MEADSDAENQNRSNESKRIGNNSSNNNNNHSNEGQQGKPKRQMKTPFQLETLEKAYASETYPSESTRAELSEKLGLSDRQLQMWFCHRRLKDKKEKENPPKKMRKNAAVVMPESPVDELRPRAEPGSDYGSGSGSGSSPYLMELRNAVGSSWGLMDDVPMVRRSYESQQSIIELRAIECVEAQLGESLREDGPILGMEFDSLPPDAFGAPIASSEQQQSGHPYESKVYDRHDTKSNKVIPRALHEYQSLSEQPYFHGSPVDGSRARMSFIHANEPSSRVHGVQGHVSRVRVLSLQDKPGQFFSSPNGGEDSLHQRESTTNSRVNAQSTSHPIFGTEDPYLLSDGQTFNNDAELRLERKRKSDEARIAREAEANEIQMRKELERQDILRRKSEEKLRKEMEKHERERRKEEERLMRERQREEERSLREQKREMERREKFLQKEYLRAEKMRLREELRMEKQEAKRKVAIEKATARKMAKESMDLIEDEQLELMDLAAASKGLSSIIHLDLDTLQNLDSFRDSLCVFPPKSVQLKRPFAVQPWSDSEKNIGNVLMVWRFFITFADVLGLWPFTLDEFVQALHDYDSRLLGEINLALLKSIIKDIEDVARMPSTGLGTNQYCTANPEGGHPRIIEGAYAWGFDIRNWQRHLNPLTWPEIFRQLALAAGFGPKLKKRSGTWASLGDKHEFQGKGCEDIVSTIRNGSAAENAFAWMREKGLLLPRRSRHKLTPGTVKFAAFHVLSLEGSKGLTVLELAEKIQKSGLRDLTSSKTPEASISVALTRDTKLFERIAPSTYCVRPAFRKDPADTEAILAAARKKIRIFENGFLVGEDADDVERDEDSECDVDEDPEVEDLVTPSNANKIIERYDEANTYSVSGKDNVCNDVVVSVQNEVDKGFSSFSLNGSKDARCQSTTEIAVEDFGASHLNQENIEIDESKHDESWIQGLAEGDYSHLSVEERLNALVALIGVANEGNCIRAVLEDRLEAANALKKQMWAEAQLDKSRLKEENITRLDFMPPVGSKAETHLASSAAEGSQSLLSVIVDNKNEASPSLAEEQKPMLGSQVVQNHLSDFPTDRTLAVQDHSTGLDNLATQQHGYASKRSRSQLKAYIAHMAEEMYVYRSLPVGQDRRRNRYWQFATSASRNDPCSGRIFVELNDGTWRLIDTTEAFDALLSSLDTRGTRESHLRIMLQKIEMSFKEKIGRNLLGTDSVGQRGTTVKNEAADMDVDPDFASSDSPSSAVCGLNSDTLETSSSFRIELGRTEIEKKAALERYQDFQLWMWKECFNSLSLCALKNEKTRCTQLLAICDVCLDSYPSEDAHCPSCRRKLAVDNSSKFSEHPIQFEEKRKLGLRDILVSDSSLPLGTRLLKPLSAVIEAYIPPEALEALWTEENRKTWGMKLNRSSSAEEVLQILTILESSIKRPYLSSNFETTKELLGSSITSADPWSAPILPWIPKTTAAVALRLLELDASITYVKPEKAGPFEDKEVNECLISSRFLPHKNKEVELKELGQDGLVKENYSNLAGKRKNYGRGKGNRDHGWSRKYHRKTPSITADAGRRNIRENENLNHQLKQQGIRTTGRGRRTVRKRADRTSKNDTFRGQMAHMVIPNSSRVLSRNLDEEEWVVEKGRMINMEDAENSNSVEADSDDNAQAVEYEQGNWEVGFNGDSNGWNRDMMEVSDEDEDASGDDPGIEEVADEDSEGNLEMSEPSDQNVIDEGMDSAASEYSD